MPKTSTANTAFGLLQRTLRLFALGILSLGALSACAVAPGGLGGGDTWQEEVLLHDGQKLVIERSQTYGGRSEIGQDAPVATHTIRFVMPQGPQTITWNSPFDSDAGRASLRLLAVHVKDGIPYVVAEPNLCQSYNKWGRPNPPYVIFKWVTNAWQRIGIEAVPLEFTATNVSRYVSRMWARDRNGQLITAEQIQTLNVSDQPQYRSILREPMGSEQIIAMCGDKVLYKGRWILRNDPVARQWIDREEQEKSK